MSGFSPASTPIIDPSGTFFGPGGSGSVRPVTFIQTFNTTTVTYAYSRDGATWSAGVFPVNAQYGALAYGGAPARWVAIMNTRITLTSPDGINWTQHANALPNGGFWSGIAWSPTLNLFAAVNSFGGALTVCTSPDGIIWTAQGALASLWNDVIWSSRLGLFIAANTAFGNPIALTSPDGVNWTPRNASAAANAAWIQDYGATFGVMGIQAGSATYATTPDGITWTEHNTVAGEGPGAGAVFVIGGNAYCLKGANQPYDMRRTATVDLSGGWASINANAAPGLAGASGLQKAAFSAQLGLWAWPAGAANAAFAVTASTSGAGAVTAHPTVATVAASPLLISAAF